MVFLCWECYTFGLRFVTVLFYTKQGEDLYISGTADKYKYYINYQNISGCAYIPVKIETLYRLRWYDTSGNYNVEDELIERWYYVKKNYKYVSIKNVKKFDLTEAVISSECFGDIIVDDFQPSGGYYKKQYGNSNSHIRVNAASEYYAGVVEVDSSNRQRPSIPDDNQQYIAEKLVSELTVWSDRLDINNMRVLSDEECAMAGKSISFSSSIRKQSIYKNHIMIPMEKENKKGYRSSVRLIYSSGNERSYAYNTDINTITVHTPVAVKLNVIGDKSSNENITPLKSDIVIGDKFIVYSSFYGNHREIQGYGLRDYMKYVKTKQVKMPFSVMYGSRVYPENTWIEINSSMAVFRLLEYVKEGEYDIECRAVAVNIPAGYYGAADISGVTESNANINIDKYCAADTIHVNVIGKIYGFTVENEGERYKTGAQAVFPEQLDCNEEPLPVCVRKIDCGDSIFRLGVYSNGIGDEEGENIDIDISYYVAQEDENGSVIRKPVDIYKAEDEKFNAGSLIKMEEKINIPMVEAVKIRDGVYHFSRDLYIPNNLIVVEKGRDISDIDIKSDYVLYDKMIIVNVDVYGAGCERRKLSYENRENELRGYCNMWKKEGYNVDKFGELPLECGDVLLIGMEGIMKNSSQIIGTH